MAPQVLVLGANGRCGRAIALAFAAAGWRVHAQLRRPWTGAAPPHLEPLLLPLDAHERIVAAARGSRIVVHALNPLYTRWERELLPLGDSALGLARALGAALMLPGNVYNFGDPVPALLEESTPFAPNHAKARLRVELERRLEAATDVRTIVLRAGDFFGAGRGTWLDALMLKRLSSGRILYPGPMDVVHAWAYLPDLAHCFVRLAEHAAALPAHSALHFPGHAVTGERFVAALSAAAQELGLIHGPARAGTVPWGLFRAAGVAMPLLRELTRMSYLWRQPHALRSARLTALVGAHPGTPLDEALQATLVGLYPAVSRQRQHAIHGDSASTSRSR
jgi:nucleoside-diphosphate-sugar epimerase